MDHSLCRLGITTRIPLPLRHFNRLPVRKYRARPYATAATPCKPANHGQVAFSSHPHLLKPDEVTPGIPAQEYERRRRQLLERLPDNSLVVAVAAPIKYMSGEIFYKYRQASDFWYLTGFQEPDSAIILEKSSNSRGYRMTLFSKGKDSHKEKWEGARTGFKEAAAIFGADDAVPIDYFPAHLKSLCSMYSNIYVDGSPTSTRRPRQKSFMKYLSSPSSSAPPEFETIVDAIPSARRRNLAPEVGKLRSIKSEIEQKILRSAADISGKAHAKTMRFTRPGLSESDLAAHFEYICSLSGAQRLAYVPVVASGANALTIHYTSNNQIIQEDEMILVDAGCEYNGYASDITRTFPATGVFSSPQRDLYSAVLAAQKSCITLCYASAGYSINALHHESSKYLRQELKQIGFNLKAGDLEGILYPHFLTHPIGIDLHESAHIDRGARLENGMVITIEPGIYVPPSAAFPKAFHNMGIRIEDEVLITQEHPTVLTINAPKEIADVEGACQGSLGLEPY